MEVISAETDCEVPVPVLLALTFQMTWLNGLTVTVNRRMLTGDPGDLTQLAKPSAPSCHWGFVAMQVPTRSITAPGCYSPCRAMPKGRGEQGFDDRHIGSVARICIREKADAAGE